MHKPRKSKAQNINQHLLGHKPEAIKPTHRSPLTDNTSGRSGIDQSARPADWNATKEANQRPLEAISFFSHATFYHFVYCCPISGFNNVQIYFQLGPGMPWDTLLTHTVLRD